jgi:hypothetical protein
MLYIRISSMKHHMYQSRANNLYISAYPDTWIEFTRIKSHYNLVDSEGL